MAIHTILHYPDLRLREKAQPVEPIAPETRQLVEDMAETMYAAPGVGLAAPQIGVRQRIFVEKLNKSFYCVDRGGAIQDLYDGTSFIDLLQPAPAWWPDAEVITDFLCPSGCITSPAYVME